MATQDITADSWYFTDESTNYGNGQGPQMYVGHTSFGSLTGRNRFAIKIPRGTLFNNITSSSQIDDFIIHLRVYTSNCDGVGGTVAFFLERATASMGENTYAVDCGVYTSGTSGVARWPAPATTATDRAFYTGSPTAGSWISVHAKALGVWWFSNPNVTELVLVGTAANTTGTALDENTNARRCHFYTCQTTSAPYAETVVTAATANRAPGVPTDVAVAYGTDGTSVTITSRYNDLDGDTATKYEVSLVTD